VQHELTTECQGNSVSGVSHEPVNNKELRQVQHGTMQQVNNGFLLY